MYFQIGTLRWHPKHTHFAGSLLFEGIHVGNVQVDEHFEQRGEFRVEAALPEIEVVGRRNRYGVPRIENSNQIFELRGIFGNFGETRSVRFFDLERIFNVVSGRLAKILECQNQCSWFFKNKSVYSSFLKADISSQLPLGVLLLLSDLFKGVPIGGNSRSSAASALLPSVSYKNDTDDCYNYGYNPYKSCEDQKPKSPLGHLLLGVQIFFGALGIAGGFYCVAKAANRLFNGGDLATFFLKFFGCIYLSFAGCIVVIHALANL